MGARCGASPSSQKLILKTSPGPLVVNVAVRDARIPAPPTEEWPGRSRLLSGREPCPPTPEHVDISVGINGAWRQAVFVHPSTRGWAQPSLPRAHRLAPCHRWRHANSSPLGRTASSMSSRYCGPSASSSSSAAGDGPRKRPTMESSGYTSQRESVGPTQREGLARIRNALLNSTCRSTRILPRIWDAHRPPLGPTLQTHPTRRHPMRMTSHRRTCNALK